MKNKWKYSGAFLSLFLMILVASAHAQKNTLTIGFGPIYGTGTIGDGEDLPIQNDWGMAVNLHYRPGNRLRFGVSYGVFLPHNDAATSYGVSSEGKGWVQEFNLLANYFFVQKGLFSAYALGGLNVTKVNLDLETTGGVFPLDLETKENEKGLALGLGLELNLSFVSVYADARYNWSPWVETNNLFDYEDQLVLGTGLRFYLQE